MSAKPAVTGSDMTEAADGKSKILVSSTSEAISNPPNFFDPIKNELKYNWAPRFITPVPILPTAAIRIDSDAMRRWFRSIRQDLIRCLYPDMWFRDIGLINEENFVLVCRYLVLARCDYVYQRFTGNLLEDSVHFPTELRMPNSLAAAVNGIGVVVVQGCALTVTPQREQAIGWIPNNLPTLFQTFTFLVRSAEQRGFITTSYMNTEITGNPWWLIGATTAGDVNVAANAIDDVNLRSQIFDATPKDYALAGIIQRGFDGILNGLENSAEFHTEMHGALAARINFNVYHHE